MSVIEETSAVRATQIGGDVTVGRNVHVGGGAEIQSSVVIGHNLKVEGWLEAPNIKDVNKGVFVTLSKLNEAYPQPHNGWIAGVVTGTEIKVYIGDGGEWVPTAATMEYTGDINAYTEAVNELIAALGAKQDLLTFDEVPVDGSTNPVKSNGIYDALQEKVSRSDVAQTTGSSTTEVMSQAAVTNALAGKASSAVSDLVAVLAGQLNAKQDKLTFDNEPTQGSQNPVKSGGVYSSVSSVAAAAGAAAQDAEAAAEAAAAAQDAASVADGKAVDAQQGVAALNAKLGASNGIATLGTDGKLTGGQVPSDVARLDGSGKLESSQVPSDLVTATELAAVEDKADAAQGAADAAQSAADAAQSAAEAVAATVAAMMRDGYKFMGVATPATEPETPSENVFYLCTTEGYYTHFPTNTTMDGEVVYFHVGADEVAILRYTIPTGDTPAVSNWSKVTLNLAKSTHVTELRASIASVASTSPMMIDLWGEGVPSSEQWANNRVYYDASGKVLYRGNSNEAWTNISAELNTSRIYVDKSNNISYRWDGADMEAISTKDVPAAIYNPTVLDPLGPKGLDGYYKLVDMDEPGRSAVHSALNNGKAVAGLIISFKISSTVWKTYQYIGTTLNEVDWLNATNWQDFGNLAKGSEGYININATLKVGNVAYDIASALKALRDYEVANNLSYAKLGMIISYITSTSDYTVEAKIYAGKSLGDFYNAELWVDFGGGSVETSALPAEGGIDAFSTGGAYTHLPTTIAKTSSEQEELNGTIRLQLHNAAGEGIGNEVAFNVGTGGGGGSAQSFSIKFEEGTRKAANIGNRVTLHACIRSVETVGDDITTYGIRVVNIYNASTNTLLMSYDFDGQSSSAIGTYDFLMDVSEMYKEAGKTNLRIVATDTKDQTTTTYFNAVCVDVRVHAESSLTSAGSSVRVGGGSQNLDSFYKFPVNTSGSITAYAEIQVDGVWMPLGEAEVRSTYTQSLSINPDDIDGNGTSLTHGAYPVRIHGVDASGVEGNWLHTAIMVIAEGDPTPIIVSRWYTESASGTIRCFDNVEVEYASYCSERNPLAIDIIENGVTMATVNNYRTLSGTYKHQVSSPSGNIVVVFRSGGVESQRSEWLISGSVIDAALTAGAIYTFDFANRSNSDADKSIVSGNYAMSVTGVNWSSNGFGRYLGANCLAVKDRMQVSLNHSPFSTSSNVGTKGFAMLLRFASQYAIDDDAKLLSCYSAGVGGNMLGAGFYITGNKVAIYSTLGEPQIAERRYPAGKAVTVGITIDPSDVYISNGGVRYSMMRLYLDGDLVGCVGYPSANASGALIQESNITMDGTSANFYLYYMIGWQTYPDYREMFENYLVKLTEATEMVNEFNFENVFTDNTGRPMAAELYSRGMAYVIEAPLGTYNGDAVSQDMTAPDKTTSTKAPTYIDLFYYNPSMPWRNFVAVNVQRRNQGTTSTKRPVKNSRYYLGADKGSGSYRDGKTHLYSIAEQRVIATLTSSQRADYELWLKLLSANKVRVGANTIPVDMITIKVDYSDSTNANDCGVCNMMNATYRALGEEYLTPAQRYFDGTYTFRYTDADEVAHTETISGLELDHSTANHPVAVFRALSGGTSSLTMYAKGNWKEDKNESKALGFYGTPGYNAGCHSYQEADFVEWVAPSSVNTISAAVNMFLTDFGSGHAWDESTEKDPSKLYLVTLYCGSSYRFMRYSNGSWYDSTGNYAQDTNGEWQISAGVNGGTDVLAAVDGFELREYASLCWWRDVAQVSDMMQMVTSADGEQPKWMHYFESMVDCDELTALYQNGHKVPYWLYRFLIFTNSVSDTEEGSAQAEAQRLLWKTDAWKYMKVKPVMAYDAATDYNTLVDQQSKNMQPMFFLDDGGSVVGGDYADESKMLMYPNKVYDADGANGKDNETVASVDPEVDPNKPDDPTTGYTNPYAGKNSVLWRNLYLQPEVVYNGAGSTVTMRSVVALMRSLNVRVDDKFTGSPFSPEGAKHFFIEQICKAWQKTVSGYDGETKFIRAKELDADGHEKGTVYFKSVYGLRLSELDEYISTRWRARDGFYGCGAFTASYLNFRMGAGVASSAGITIKAAKSGYFGIGFQTPGSVSESVYLEAGESHRFTNFSHEDNSDTYIYQPDRISELDLSEIVVTNTASFARCSLLRKLNFGGASHDESIAGANGFITTLSLGELPFLVEIDVRNTHIKNIDASGCPRLEKLDASNSPLESLVLAETSPVSVLTLPASVSSLKLVNLPSLSYGAGGLTIAGLTHITSLHVDGCPMLDGVALLADVVAAQKALTPMPLSHLRLTGANMTGHSDNLRYLMTNGVHGLDANGAAITESGCSGMVGVWTCSDVIEATLLANLQANFPLLTIYNAQYSIIRFVESGKMDGSNNRISEDPTGLIAADQSNMVNMEDGSYNGNGDEGYKVTGHVLKIRSKLHTYIGHYDSTSHKMQCRQVSDAHIGQYASGGSCDVTCSGNEDDVFVMLPHFWYKGVNDYVGGNKYLIISSLDTEPRSSAAATVKSVVSDLVIAERSSLNVANFNVGDAFDAGNLSTSNIFCVGRVNVSGKRHVRWPGVNSNNDGGAFLDASGKVIKLVTTPISMENSGFAEGEYMFVRVPDGAAEFVFTSPISAVGEVVVTTDSGEVEAIEPDWVEHEPCLVGAYQGYISTSNWLLRSISGAVTQGSRSFGSNQSGTSNRWEYNESGEVTNGLPDGSVSMNRSWKDMCNLANCRGAGYQLIDYEMHKVIALLWMAFHGTRHSQSINGAGVGLNGKTGDTDSITGYGDSPMRESESNQRPRTMGFEDLWGNGAEWMDNVMVNVSSMLEYKRSFKTNKPEGLVPSDSIGNAVWQIIMPDGTERSVQGAGVHNQEIMRVRWGRYCDMVPSATIANTSYNTYFCDNQEYNSGTGRVVARSGHSSSVASNGLAFVNAYNASSSANFYIGSRLAFRGEIELVE